MSAASLDEQPKLSVVVPAASPGGDSLGKSPRPQVPPDGEEDEGIHSDEEEVKAMHGLTTANLIPCRGTLQSHDYSHYVAPGSTLNKPPHLTPSRWSSDNSNHLFRMVASYFLQIDCTHTME